MRFPEDLLIERGLLDHSRYCPSCIVLKSLLTSLTELNSVDRSRGVLEREVVSSNIASDLDLTSHVHVPSSALTFWIDIWRAEEAACILGLRRGSVLVIISGMDTHLTYNNFSLPRFAWRLLGGCSCLYLGTLGSCLSLINCCRLARTWDISIVKLHWRSRWVILLTLRKLWLHVSTMRVRPTKAALGPELGLIFLRRGLQSCRSKMDCLSDAFSSAFDGLYGFLGLLRL